MANVNSTLVLIGYFPKRRMPAPKELCAAGAEEICSVSETIDSPDDAERVAGDAEGEYEYEYEVFVYRLLPPAIPQGTRPRTST